MRFRIIYPGELKSAGGSNRLKDKWSIREAISPQLEELWLRHPMLQGGVSITDETQLSPEGYIRELSAAEEAARQARSAAKMRVPYVVGGIPFIPLIRKAWEVTCGLDILFLRKDVESSVIYIGGDLDNRLKVLFDGLRMPTLDEIGKRDAQEYPIYCLTEDDSLISDVAVRTDRLLSRPNASSSEVTLVIEVTLRLKKINNHNTHFLFPIG